MRRRRETPWIHNWSRYLIAAIATIGAIGTGYLTITKLVGGAAGCSTEGCNQVLSSPYATVFGLPLTLFGFLAYASMVMMAVGPLALKTQLDKDTQLKLENWTWRLLFMGAAAMTIFSAYLMYVLAFKIEAVCPYCIGSALLSLGLLVLTIIGREWEDVGQLFFNGFIIAVVTLVGTLGIYAGVNNPTAVAGADGKTPPPIETTSGPAEIALAEHLSAIGAKKYSAWWCPHCHDQQRLFGREAFSRVDYVECDPEGQNPQTETCQAVGIKSYPTWEINGELHAGVKPLNEIADLSGYTGPRGFQR
ncbi:MAG: vitamin K epoxide reductase family protein [Cyanothece sp. SIO1E1]|nr:vitamin K epoxide reductase family protein [Cyanothece sp. SIO1E1]